jgi:hypothetical protein
VPVELRVKDKFLKHLNAAHARLLLFKECAMRRKETGKKRKGELPIETLLF